MSRCKDTLQEGWLTKSPPTKRIWRGRWRRRWFVLHPGDLPQQYILAYYTDRNCRKLKGIIDLDHCDQVDIGFKFEDKKVKFDFLFAIKTQPRTYYLAADSDIELRNWVKCICDVCGLKATSEDDDGVQFIEEKSPIEVNEQKHILDSPPVSPVSTSPYIPISECITGKSPILLKNNNWSKRLLLSCDAANSINQNHSNALYETPAYLNCAYPTSYESPRCLLPIKNTISTGKESDGSSIRKNSISPLQSPFGSDSVFTDESWTSFKQSSRNLQDSDTSEDALITQKFTKIHIDSNTSEDFLPVPPRPPKPSYISQSPLPSSNYFNISTQSALIKTSKNNDNSDDISFHGISDEIYDFPRSHQVEGDLSQNSITKRHCYNNAAPILCQDGQIFKYDVSPKAGSSNQQVFLYDLDDSDVPPSPSSQNSSVYYNLSSPLLPDTQLISPPAIDRGLKPKRKLSDTLSISSNTEPSSPRLAPSIDRKLKPVGTSLCHTETPGNLKKRFDTDMDSIYKLKAAPSPTPTRLRSDDIVSDNEQTGIVKDTFALQAPKESAMTGKDFTICRVRHTQCFSFPIANSLQNYHKLEYLDLDLDNKAPQFTISNALQPLRSPGANTVYKKVDFMKTEAFNITRNNLEKERNARFE